MPEHRSVGDGRLVFAGGYRGRGITETAYEIGEFVDCWWRLDRPRVNLAILLPGEPGIWVRCQVTAYEPESGGLVVSPVGQEADFPATFTVFRPDLVRSVP